MTMLKITPFDTVFFRDGKPFYRGAENFATGVFPPAPSVVYGALRTAFFAGYIPRQPKAPGDPTENFRLRGVYLECGGEACFPLPMDCVCLKDEADNRAILMDLKKNDLLANYPLPYYLEPDVAEEVQGVRGGLLNDLSLCDYLHLSTREFYYDSLAGYVTSEPKVGIARNPVTRASEDTMLYSIEMKRPVDLSFLADFTGLALPQEGFLKLGGEGRPASFKRVKPVEIEAPSLRGQVFKLYFATPAVFSQGWLPGWLDENTLEGEYGGLKLRLLTAVLDRYQPIGGFAISQRRAKALRRMVPAGSVYYFELLGGEMDKVAEVFHRQNIIGIDPGEDTAAREGKDYFTYAKQGFGLAFVGEVQT
jgi:CRISPR-associated protein Cmr3